MKTSSTREKALAYLRDHNVMTLATNGPAGIWAAALFYANEGLTFYFLSSPDSRHAVNIAGNPLVSATVQEDYHDWREIKGIQLEGEAARIEGLENSQALERYALKFPIICDLVRAPAEIIRAYGRIVWFRLKPCRIYFIDNSLGLGHRDEVPL